MKLTKTSLRHLQGVHPDLVKVVMRAAEITEQPFLLTDGVRTLAEQRRFVQKGVSKTMNSRHLTGHAVDVVAMVGRRVSWELPLYYVIADAMKQAAEELGIPIEWGGDWRSIVDGPHFQLPWNAYPKDANPALGKTPPEVTDRSEALAAKTLWIGAEGDAVVALQRKLNRLGYGLKVDGDFGPRTRTAVLRFQRSAGLKRDGIVGRKTRSALRAALSRR